MRGPQLVLVLLNAIFFACLFIVLLDGLLNFFSPLHLLIDFEVAGVV